MDCWTAATGEATPPTSPPCRYFQIMRNFGPEEDEGACELASTTSNICSFFIDADRIACQLHSLPRIMPAVVGVWAFNAGIFFLPSKFTPIAAWSAAPFEGYRHSHPCVVNVIFTKPFDMKNNCPECRGERTRTSMLLTPGAGESGSSMPFPAASPASSSLR